METAIIDTLAITKRFKAAGFTEEQAEVQAEVLSEIMDQNLANKQDIQTIRKDIKELDVNLRKEIKELEVSLKRDIKELDTKIETTAKELTDKLTIRLGSLLVVAVGVFSIIVTIAAKLF